MGSIGWICLHRKIQECFLWVEDEPFDRRSAWIDLLLLANHEDKKMMFDAKPIVVKRGQRITSIRLLSERWGWSKTKVTTFLKVLEEEGMIIRDSDKKRTLLTVVNYDLYQDIRDSEKTVKRQSKDTEKTLTGTLTGPKQQSNNDNNENNIKPPYPPFGEPESTAWNYDKHTNVDNVKHVLNEKIFDRRDYLGSHRDIYDAVKTWMEYKDARKPRTSNHYANEKSICMFLAMVVKNSEAGEDVVDRINYSMANNYQGVAWQKKPKAVTSDDGWEDIK